LTRYIPDEFSVSVDHKFDVKAFTIPSLVCFRRVTIFFIIVLGVECLHLIVVEIVITICVGRVPELFNSVVNVVVSVGGVCGVAVAVGGVRGVAVAVGGGSAIAIGIGLVWARDL